MTSSQSWLGCYLVRIFCVFVSQSKSLRSNPALNNRAPFGDQANAVTWSIWPPLNTLCRSPSFFETTWISRVAVDAAKARPSGCQIARDVDSAYVSRLRITPSILRMSFAASALRLYIYTIPSVHDSAIYEPPGWYERCFAGRGCSRRCMTFSISLRSTSLTSTSLGRN